MSQQQQAAKALWRKVRAGELPPPEGKGHWPRGKARHPEPSKRVRKALTKIRGYLALPYAEKIPTLTNVGVAEEIGVNLQTVRRWVGTAVDGREHNPNPEHWDAILAVARRLSKKAN